MSHSFAGVVLLGIAACATGYAMTDHGSKFFADPSFDVYTVAGHGIGCMNISDEMRLQMLEASGDNEAVREFLHPRYALDSCSVISKGDQVVIEEKMHHSIKQADFITHGLVCARRIGKSFCYWIPTAFLFPELAHSTAN